ncbi:MAG: hypothetical protein KDC34_01315 [Saprospiraceae bacterium]|nr:hypothetical protein [Saprospiraceae bacterium]
MKSVSTFVLLLTLLLVSCNQPGQPESVPDEQAQAETTAPAATDVPGPQTAFADTELAYYQPQMNKYGFTEYPAITCDPITTGVTPKIAESSLAGLDIQVQVLIEEKVLGSAPNFNCQYHVVYWNCGASCKMVAVFNSKTGKLVQVFETAFGAIFSPKSRMLILNPPRNEKMDVSYRQSMGIPEFWELQGDTFKQHLED